MIQSLLPGEVGMFKQGTYWGLTTWHGDATRDGTATQRITLTNYPGEKATIIGWGRISKSYWTIKNLYFNTTNTGFHPAGPQALELGGSNMIFEYNDVYQDISVDQGDRILLGGDDSMIRFCRIHDCGKNQRQDHCIYHKEGDSCQVYGNWIWGATRPGGASSATPARPTPSITRTSSTSAPRGWWSRATRASTASTTPSTTTSSSTRPA